VQKITKRNIPPKLKKLILKSIGEYYNPEDCEAVFRDGELTFKLQISFISRGNDWSFETNKNGVWVETGHGYFLTV
jgi:hypothetical protein